MIRKIVQSKDPILRRTSKPVEKIDAKILEIIKDLKETLIVQKDPEGVGLAAPQIGKNLRIFVTRYENFNRVVINPEIIEAGTKKRINEKNLKKNDKQEILEGCLSLPNYYGPLQRLNYVKFKYLNEEAKEVIEEVGGFAAQIVLHEIDHLNGIMFLDRILEQKKSLYKLERDKWEEVELI